MIKAIQANSELRISVKMNEDALTSSVFERLMYLPKELIQQIFSKALLQDIPSLSLSQIESIEFWPHWNPKGTKRTNYVEPDVFIRTPKQDIIIEAKRYDKKQQSRRQWEDQLIAYNNEYKKDQKVIVYIALGGLHLKNEETLVSDEIRQQIFKCKWSGILQAVLAVKQQVELSSDILNVNWAINNILADIILVFRMFGFSTAPWFEHFMKPVALNPNHIQKLNFDFQWKK
jgi:hypothetical protein